MPVPNIRDDDRKPRYQYDFNDIVKADLVSIELQARVN
jgi:hypothetical protein